MSWGSSQTSNQQSQQFGSNASLATTQPNQLPWVADLQKNNGLAAQNMMARASQPIYGDAQKANYLESLNQLADASSKHLASSLAGRGIMDSGAFSAGQTGIEAGRLGQASSFFSQLPFQEQAAQDARQKSALGLSIAAAAAPPTGQTSGSTSNSQSSSDTSSKTTTDPGISGLVSSLAGLGFGATLGGLGSLMGGGSFGSGFGASLGGGGQQGGGGGGWQNPVAPPWYQQAAYPQMTPGGSAPYQSTADWAKSVTIPQTWSGNGGGY